MLKQRWRRELFNVLVSNTAKPFFDPGSSDFFRVRACVYSYNKILKKDKSLIFLDFGLKEKSQENTFNVYTFYNERLSNSCFLPYNRFYNYLPRLSLGSSSIVCYKNNAFEDYFYISNYDLMHDKPLKYAENVVDILFKFNRLLARPFYEKLFDIDRWVSDYYPLRFENSDQQKLIIRNFTSYWDFYINRGENIRLGVDLFNKFYRYWGKYFSTNYKKFVEFLENRVCVNLKLKWENDLFFFKMSLMMQMFLKKHLHIYLFLKCNKLLLLRADLLLRVFYLYRFVALTALYECDCKTNLIGDLILRIFGAKGFGLNLFFYKNYYRFIRSSLANIYKLKSLFYKRRARKKGIKKKKQKIFKRQLFSYFMLIKRKFRYKRRSRYSRYHRKNYLARKIYKIPIWNSNWYLTRLNLNVKFIFKHVLKNFCFFIIFLYKRYFLYPLIGLCEKFVLNSFFWISNFIFIKRFFIAFYSGKGKVIKWLSRKPKYKRYKIKKLLKFRLLVSFLKRNKKLFLNSELLNKKVYKSLKAKLLMFILSSLFKSKDCRFLKCKNIKFVI